VFLLKNVQNPLWSVGAEFAAPIWTGGRLQAAVAARAAEQQAASADFARIGARSFADVENAIDGEAALRERAAYAAAALAAQRRALGVTEVEFRVGRTDERPVVQQQLRVRAAEMNALHIHAETLSQRVMLHLALGGDFGTASAAGPTLGWQLGVPRTATPPG
jgi:outer membrane protein TolC